MIFCAAEIGSRTAAVSRRRTGRLVRCDGMPSAAAAGLTPHHPLSHRCRSLALLSCHLDPLCSDRARQRRSNGADRQRPGGSTRRRQWQRPWTLHSSRATASIVIITSHPCSRHPRRHLDPLAIDWASLRDRCAAGERKGWPSRRVAVVSLCTATLVAHSPTLAHRVVVLRCCDWSGSVSRVVASRRPADQ